MAVRELVGGSGVAWRASSPLLGGEGGGEVVVMPNPNKARDI